MEAPGPLTVLLVEDEPDIRLVTRLALQCTGAFVVVEADSGAAALSKAATLRPDVVLLDVMMPEMDGPAVLRALGSDPATSDIPIVFLTAKATTEDLARLGALGAAGIITKPFDATTIAADLRATLERRTATPSAARGPGPSLTSAVNQDALRMLDGLVGEHGRDIRLDLYDLFAERTPAVLKQLQSMPTGGVEDANEMARQAHSLKSAAATLGLDGIAALCAQIEGHASAGRLAEVRPLVDRLVAEFEPALALLKAACLRFAPAAPVSHPDRSS